MIDLRKEALKEMDMSSYSIRCNNCYNAYNEDDLEKMIDKKTNDFMDACPVCKTDAYLMDIK